MNTQELIESLTEQEVMNELNYPGISKFLPEINEILSFADDFNDAVDKFYKKVTPYINILLTDLEVIKSRLRKITEQLSEMDNVPIHVLFQLRSIQKNLSLMSSFSHLYVENYKTVVEVE